MPAEPATAPRPPAAAHAPAPLVEVGRGVVRGGDGYKAGEAATHEALAALTTHEPSGLLVFATLGYPIGRVLAGVADASHGAPMAGATTVEALDGPREASVVVTAVGSPHLAFHAGLGTHVGHDWRQALDEALASPPLAPWFGGSDDLWSGLRRQGKGAFLFLVAPASPPAHLTRGAELVEALRRRSGHRVPVFAAAAGTPGGEEHHVFLGERVVADGLLVGLVETKLKLGASSLHPLPGEAAASTCRDALRTALLRGDVLHPAVGLVAHAGLRGRTGGAAAQREVQEAATLLAGAPILGLPGLTEPGEPGASAAAVVLGGELSEASRVAEENATLRREVEQWFLALGQSNSALMRLNGELRAEMAERVRAETSHRQVERQQRALLDGISDYAWLKDTAGRYLAANRPLARALGVEPEAMVGRTDAELFPPALAAKYQRDDREVLASATVLKVEEPFIDCAGVRGWVESIKVPWLDADGRVAGTVGVARDVSQRRLVEAERWNVQSDLERLVFERTAELEAANSRLQAEVALRGAADAEKLQLMQHLQQSQKMEAMGRLAAGVAHDFNNVVTVILSGAAELGRNPAETPELAAEIQAAGERAARLTKQLLAFSRQQPIEPRTVEVDELCRGFEPIAVRLAGRRVKVTASLRSGARAHVDPGQLEQVLMNLVVNARDAMPEGGSLTVATAALTAGDPELAHRGLTGDWLRLSVADTGAGMSEAVQQRIFEPFFTTKPKGQGTGLGLATVFGVVKQSGGFVTVVSAPGQGSTFHVHLPRLGGPTPALHEG